MTRAQPPYPTADHHHTGDYLAHREHVLHFYVELDADEIDVRYQAQRHDRNELLQRCHRITGQIAEVSGKRLHAVFREGQYDYCHFCRP